MSEKGDGPASLQPQKTYVRVHKMQVTKDTARARLQCAQGVMRKQFSSRAAVHVRAEVAAVVIHFNDYSFRGTRRG